MYQSMDSRTKEQIAHGLEDGCTQVQIVYGCKMYYRISDDTRLDNQSTKVQMARIWKKQVQRIESRRLEDWNTEVQMSQARR